ncbi:MAG TPA: pilus assembly protein TadG-related protein [Methylocella sp.]|nr:pilus assembly protein TadG-related protein [Methylocella sp.]
MRFNVKRSFYRLRSERRGNVAMITALSIFGLVGTAGLGVDYYNALAQKSRLDSASDAAALAAINAASSYIAANSATQTDPALTAAAIAAGQTQGTKVFNANAASAVNSTVSPTVSVTRSGQTFNATVSYTSKVNNAFGPLFGYKQSTVDGQAQSSLTMATYLDFYLLLDVSGSMGIPTAPADQTTLAGLNPDNKDQYPSGCVFACHFTPAICDLPQNYLSYLSAHGSPPPPSQWSSTYTSSQACQGYTVARANGIALRADTVGSAVAQLLQTAVNSETLPNQFRVGIYPFISYMGQLYPTNGSAVSTDLVSAQTAANTLGSLLETGESGTAYGAGGTHFENVLPAMNTTITTIGNGSGASSPKPFVFLVTDGADNNQYYTTSTGSWTGSQPQLFNPSLCTTLKNRGITISVLYIPYQPITNPNPSFAGNEDCKVNALLPTPLVAACNGVSQSSPYIPNILQECASPGFYFSAYTAQDITNAMQAMFAQSLAAARLTE